LTAENASDQEPQASSTEKPKLKPYNKPSFRFESVFETTALSCGKINATQLGCHLNRKKS
jgi:hypothetical protein